MMRHHGEAEQVNFPELMLNEMDDEERPSAGLGAMTMAGSSRGGGPEGFLVVFPPHVRSGNHVQDSAGVSADAAVRRCCSGGINEQGKWQSSYEVHHEDEEEQRQQEQRGDNGASLVAASVEGKQPGDAPGFGSPITSLPRLPPLRMRGGSVGCLPPLRAPQGHKEDDSLEMWTTVCGSPPALSVSPSHDARRVYNRCIGRISTVGEGVAGQ